MRKKLFELIRKLRGLRGPIAIGGAYLLVMCLSGCTKKPAESRSSVENFKTTTLPLPVAQPDPAPATNDVAGAKEDAAIAQKNVQTVLNSAKAAVDVPLAQQAVPPLTVADNRLTMVTAKLNEATGHLNELKQRQDESDKSHAEREKLLAADIARLESACKKDNDAATKQIDSLTKENADLKDEEIRYAKHRLMGLGILCLLGGVGSVVAMFVWGFAPGRLLAEISVPFGLICITLATVLQKIVFWTEVSLVAFAVGVVVLGLWKTFWHRPPDAVAPGVAAAQPAPPLASHELQTFAKAANG